MVGQLGSTPLAASSFANNIVNVLVMFGIGMSYGITPLVAQADGEQDESKLPNYYDMVSFFVEEQDYFRYLYFSD